MLDNKRTFLDSADMNNAFKSPKSPKTQQALINEIVNDETQEKEVDDVPAKPSKQ